LVGKVSLQEEKKDEGYPGEEKEIPSGGKLSHRKGRIIEAERSIRGWGGKKGASYGGAARGS